MRCGIKGPLWEGTAGNADWGRELKAFVLSLRRYAPPPSRREAQSLRHGFAAPPPFTQGSCSLPPALRATSLTEGGTIPPSRLRRATSLYTREAF
nr:MAG TPA: hypothetical protein [Caudoviricetes sp.]